MKHTVYLSLGSNLGDRKANLKAAAAALAPIVGVLRASRIYQTAPWGYLDQPDFLNQVLECETELAPLELLAHLKRIEKTLGRQPGVRYGPRLIDLDILFYDQLVVDLPELTIPHPRAAERAFVLVPLADLAPGLVHPVLMKTAAELLAALDAGGVTRWPAGTEDKTC